MISPWIPCTTQHEFPGCQGNTCMHSSSPFPLLGVGSPVQQPLLLLCVLVVLQWQRGKGLSLLKLFSPSQGRSPTYPVIQSSLTKGGLECRGDFTRGRRILQGPGQFILPGKCCVWHKGWQCWTGWQPCCVLEVTNLARGWEGTIRSTTTK